MLRKVLSAAVFLWTSTVCSTAQESLLIGPGDQLHVQVFDTPEMDQHPRVTDAGAVPLLFIGKVKVASMTPGDAAREIETVLMDKKYMLHPHVEVTVEDYATQQVTVMGQVKSAGTYEITAPTSVITILSMAGGLTELADRHVTIQRHGDPGERVPYFLANVSEEALNQSVNVYPGDTVLVPKAPVIYIMGDVARPGGYPIQTNDQKISILQALALAGAANHTAVLSKTRLIRKTPTGTNDIKLNLAGIEKGKEPDPEMHSDDILFVPFSWMKNAVLASSAIATSASSALIYAHP